MSAMKTKLTRVPKQLAPFVETKLRARDENLSAVQLVIGGLREPASRSELRILTERATGVKMSEQTVISVLEELARRGEVFSRLESRDERSVRAGGNKKFSRGPLGHLYFGSKSVPDRVTTALVPGVVLGDGSTETEVQRRARQRYQAKQKRRRARAKKQRRARRTSPARATNPVTAVEELVKRAERLSRENAELRALVKRITDAVTG